MAFTRAFFPLGLTIGCAMLAEAKTSMRRVSGTLREDHQKGNISPELEPESDKKFFHKDYPFDKRPKADPFHFHHPYPAVQDSGDYDADYVKDENSDNGNWKAQETYDRLRTKLARQKRDLAKAFEKKKTEDQELEDAMEHEKQEEHKKDEAIKRVDEVEKKHKQNAERGAAESEVKPTEGKPAEAASPKKAGDKDLPAGSDVKGVDAATDETKHAVDRLEECKKQLAAARKQLRKLMNELDAAKEAQGDANKALDKAASNQLKAEEQKAKEAGKVHDEYEDYLKAKEAYEKQQAVVDKLGGDVKVAAAKVKHMRDTESKKGGVYPTPEEETKSGGVSVATPKLLALTFVGLIASW